MSGGLKGPLSPLQELEVGDIYILTSLVFFCKKYNYKKKSPLCIIITIFCLYLGAQRAPESPPEELEVGGHRPHTI